MEPDTTAEYPVPSTRSARVRNGSITLEVSSGAAAAEAATAAESPEAATTAAAAEDPAEAAARAAEASAPPRSEEDIRTRADGDRAVPGGPPPRCMLEMTMIAMMTIATMRSGGIFGARCSR